MGLWVQPVIKLKPSKQTHLRYKLPFGMNLGSESGLVLYITDYNNVTKD